MHRKKISLIGAGNIGGTLAHLSLLKELGDIVLFDVNGKVAQGKALDLAQSSFVHKTNINIIGTSNYEDTANSDVIIVTAGMPRKPGMSRDDLVKNNTKVMIEVGKNIATYSPNAFVICVTNPLDVMVWVLQQSSCLPVAKVVGMAGVLDTSRFAYFLSQALNVAIADIQAFVLGGHGDSMVPVLNYATVSGISLAHFIKNGKISQTTVEKIVDRTRNGGAEIVNLLGSGSAFYAPAAAALAMAESYLFNNRNIFPTAAWVTKNYDVSGMYVGVPVVIGSNGVEEIIEIELDSVSKENFKKSVKTVEELMFIAKKFM